MNKRLQQIERQDGQFIMSFSKSSNPTIDYDDELQKPRQKYVRFIQDGNEVNTTQQDKQAHYPQTSHNPKTNFIHHQINHQLINQFPLDMKNLLQNCKVSIQSLQKQLEIKNLQVRKLQSENQSLNIRLKDTQKQVQRTHQMLKIYIKESECKVKPFVTVSESFKDSKHQPEIQSLKSELNNHKSISEQMLRQNNSLNQENHQLRDQINKLNSQIVHLEQKLYKMGKGVGKALTTIKKNNRNFDIDQGSLNKNLQQNVKQNIRNKVNGKIVFKRLQFSAQNQFHYSTPLKKEKSLQSPNKNIASTIGHSISSKKTFQTEKREVKIKQISTHAQKIQKIDKIQLLLKKMQQLSKSWDSSQEVQDQISKHHFQSQPLSFA